MLIRLNASEEEMFSKQEAALSQARAEFSKEKAALQAKIRSRHAEWVTELGHGFSILCYGFGSKSKR